MTLLRTLVTISSTLQFVRRFSSWKLLQEVSILVTCVVIRGKLWGPTDIRPILMLHGWQFKMTLLTTSLKNGRSLRFIPRFFSEKPYQEVSIPVPWGEIRGKWWGPTNLRPILTIHGWQDNCGSFNRLIPLLNKNVSFLAIDLPGHGYSSHIPAGMYYHFSTYLLAIKYIIAYLNWPKVTLIGHSMGSICCYIYTMLYPETVDYLACIEGLKPLVNKNRIESISKTIDEFIQKDVLLTSPVEPPSYTLNEITRKIHSPNDKSIDLEVAHHIAERNIAPSKLHPGKYYFARDPRLKFGELLCFSQHELERQALKVTCPIFIAKISEGLYGEPKENYYGVLDVLRKSSRDCDFHTVDGKHHEHLNDPREIAGLLRPFIERHNTEDRRVGGLTGDILDVDEKEDLMREAGL